MALPKDDEIIEQWQKHRSSTERGLSEQYRNTQEAFAFYAGDDMRYTDFLQKSDSRKMVVFNKVKPYVNAVTGFLSQTTPNAKYYARVEDRQQIDQYSGYLNNVSDYVRFNTYADAHESMQNKDMLICGYGCVDTNMTYGDGYASRDPNGEVIMERVHPADVGWDPNAKITNLMDARWVYRKKQYELKEALELFDDSDPEDFESSQASDVYKEYFPGGGAYDKIGYDYAAGQQDDLVNVYYYQWWTTEEFYRAKNLLYDLDPRIAAPLLNLLEALRQNSIDESDLLDADDLFEFDPKAVNLVISKELKPKITTIFKQFGVPLRTIKQKRKMFYTAIVSGKKVFQKFRSPDQSGYTLKFKTADYDDRRHMWVGMVNSLKDPSLYYNKSLTELMYIIASNAKGGVMVEEDATDDIADFEKKWAKTQSAIVLRSGALAQGKVQEKARPHLNTGYELINQMSDEAISSVVGLDKSFFGVTQSGMESGALFAQRISQAFTILQSYVDSIRVYKIEHARMMITFLKMFAENSPGRLIRIINPQGEDLFAQVSMDNFVDEYDIGIEEAPKSAIERESVKQRKILLADKLALQGINIYDLIVKDLDFDPATEQVLQNRLAPQPPPPPNPEAEAYQRQLAQLELAKRQTDIAETVADTQYKEARAAGEVADIEKTQAETLKEIQEAANKEMEAALMQSVPLNLLNVNI